MKLALFAYGLTGPAALKSLKKDFDIVSVTIPPKKSRFFCKATKEVINECESNNIKLIIDTNLKDLKNNFKILKPDISVISSYNKILNQDILNLCKFINIHHGDLPRYRGRANINWAIINGRKEIGICAHEAIPDLDAGNIYKTWMIPISENDYISDVYEKVNICIEKNLNSVILDVVNNKNKGTEQEGQSTYCCTRLPRDGKINWNDDAKNILNLIRGVSKPFGGAFCDLILDPIKIQKVTIWKAYIEKNPRIYEGNIPGRVARIIKGIGAEILTKTTPIIITNVNNTTADKFFKTNLEQTLA